ncbi:hypothetical protein PR048_019989, partial [Dryococelus australis]
MIKNSDSLANVTGLESENIASKKNENTCAELKGDIKYQEFVLKNVLAPLFDSGLEKELWGEALRTAMYLLIRSPPATVDTIPAELWYGKIPDLQNLILSSSLSYAKKKLKKLGKLEKRCDKFVMVGCATNGYRLWNSENREIKLSRDVTFVESTEVSATNNSSQGIIADTVSLVDSEETKLILADNMEVRRNTTVLQDDVVDEPFQVFPSDQDTAKSSEMVDSLPEAATEIENCNHQGRKERIKRKPQYLQEYVMLPYKEAISVEDKGKWLQAIGEETSSLKKNSVLQFLDGKEISRNQELLSSRW